MTTKSATKTALIGLGAFFSVLWALDLWADANDAVAFPTGYLKWTHVKRANEPRGVHHIYANEKALEGYRTGGFPDGSIIVFDLLESRQVGGTWTEGSRKLVDVMVKDKRQYAATGGWAFEEFKGDSETDRTLTPEAKVACYNCHTSQKSRDLVFSKLTE